jgi:hypothetical protein
MNSQQFYEMLEEAIAEFGLREVLATACNIVRDSDDGVMENATPDTERDYNLMLDVQKVL